MGSLKRLACSMAADVAVRGLVGSCYRANREHPKMFLRIWPESQDQNQVLTVLYVPYSLDSGTLGGLVRSTRTDNPAVQGYLAHKKPPHPRTLQ